MDVIRVEKLNRYFGDEDNRVHVLKDINLAIRKGDFVAIMGQSGSGKSTLMNILGCLDQPTSGTYWIDGTETSEMDGDQLADLRSQKLGFIFQRYNLLSTLSARDNVALPAIYSGVDQVERNARATELLEGLGLGDRLKNNPNQLSGGQQQRVSIARAIMNGGEVILADEPTGALDSQSGEVVMGILTDLHAAGHTIIVVTHDRNVAEHASRIIEIRDGEIIADERLKPAPQDKAYSVSTASKQSSLQYYKDQFMESFRMSIQAITAHKMRSLLTMLGIIIGIASVVSVVALGRGSQERILADISSIGTNTINIYPGTGFGDTRAGRVKTLTVADSELLRGQSYISSVTPSVSATSLLVYRNQSLNAQLSGVGELYFDVRGLEIDEGRLFNRADVVNNASVVVIDPNTRDKLFANGENPLGKIIIFKRQPLEVIGVTKKQDTVFGSSDTLNLWSPYTTVMNKITGERNISSITAKIDDNVNTQVAEKNITALIRQNHGGKEDFFTQNTDSIKQTIESTTQTMTLLISCIALISLIVGGIGVMNIMLVSVTERTKEIGIRMAIGARQFNILQQFLIEAVLICLIGGLAGITLAYLFGLVFNIFVTKFPMAFSTTSVLLALGCSTMIGVIFGFVPARNASELNPIEALSRD